MNQIDYKLKKYDILIESAKNSSSRTRSVILITCIASLVIFAATFNTYYSWMRHINVINRSDFNENHGFCLKPDSTSVTKIDTNSINRELKIYTYKKFIDSYFERQSFSVPILGIKFTTHDLPILGSLGIFIIITWLFYAYRRENRVVEEIYDEFYLVIENTDNIEEKQKVEKIDYLLQGTVHNFIFTTVTKKGISFVEEIGLGFIHYLPIISLFFLLVGDVTSLYLINHFKLENIVESMNKTTAFKLYYYEIPIRYLIFSFFTILTLRITYNIRNTYKLTTDYFGKMQNSYDKEFYGLKKKK